MNLPSFVHNFDHAHIEQVIVGPRHEVTFIITPLVWDGHNGVYATPVSVRLGGISNFNEVSAFFDSRPQEQSELAWLRYAEDQHSKPGHLFVELMFERIDARLIVQCSSLQVKESTG